MLACEGADVRLTSRSIERATEACAAINVKLDQSLSAGSHANRGTLIPIAVGGASPDTLEPVLEHASILIACGAAGIELVDEATITSLSTLKVAVDLNAVPPTGIGGVSATDKARPIGSGVAYGAIGVGGLKMKTHRACVRSLFESNDRVLDAAEIYAIAKSIG